MAEGKKGTSRTAIIVIISILGVLFLGSVAYNIVQLASSSEPSPRPEAGTKKRSDPASDSANISYNNIMAQLVRRPDGRVVVEHYMRGEKGDPSGMGTLASRSWRAIAEADAQAIADAHGIDLESLRAISDRELRMLRGRIRPTVTGRVARGEPVAEAGDDLTTRVGEEVRFDASSSSGRLRSYHWDFGDGNEGDCKIAAHTYAAPGVYTVTLTVTDREGRTASDTAKVTVK